MKRGEERSSGYTRRGVLPFIAGLLVFPFAAKSWVPSRFPEQKDDVSHKLLTSDGKLVKVSSEALKNANVIRKNVSNKTLWNWLKMSKQK